MKKLLILFALCALASASFAAVTISDWTVSSNNYTSVEGLLSDVPPAGLAFDATTAPDNGSYYTSFTSDNVSGWLYDSNDTFSVVITGFDDVLGYEGGEPKTLCVTLWDNTNFCEADYVVDYSGEGTYIFGPNDIDYDFTDISEDAVIASVDVWIGDSNRLSCFAKKNTVGSVKFIVDEKEKPETAVPEPMCAAYALVGFAPIFGLKKRIRK